LLSTTHKTLSNIVPLQLTPYVDDIIGDHLFNITDPAADHIFSIHQTLL